MSTSSFGLSSSAQFDMSLYIGTERIENYLGKAWRDVSGASQGIKDHARAMAVRNFEVAEKYGDWKPIQKSYTVFTVNPKPVVLGTIEGFTHHIPSRKRKKATPAVEGAVPTPKKAKKQKGNEGKGKKAKAAVAVEGATATIEVAAPKKARKSGGTRQHRDSNAPKKIKKSGVWTDYHLDGQKNEVKHYRVETEPFVGYIMPYSANVGNLDPDYILNLTGHQSSAPGVDLAIRKAARLERNARRAANRAAFNCISFKAAKRALKAARKQTAATWNVVKLINAATRKAQAFMTAAHQRFDVNGESLVMSGTSFNKEEQTASMGDTSVDLDVLVRQMGASHLYSMSNVGWDGNHDNVFITVCAGDLDPAKEVNFNYPLINFSNVPQDLLWTHSIKVGSTPYGKFGSPDFHTLNKSMTASSTIGYVPMRTKCEYMFKERLYPDWTDLVAFNKALPEGIEDSIALQYQLIYNSYYRKCEVTAAGYVETHMSDYGTEKLTEIDGNITETRNALHKAMFDGTFDASALADTGNTVQVTQTTRDWVTNNPFTPVGYPAGSISYVGYYLVIGYVNTVNKDSVRYHVKPTDMNAKQVRVLCDKVVVYGIRYQDLKKFVQSNLPIVLDGYSKHYWRMGFYDWAYNSLIKGSAPNVDIAAAAVAPAIVESVTPTGPAVLTLPTVVESAEEEATHVEVEVVENAPALVAKEILDYVTYKPRKVKARAATDEELNQLIEAFKTRDNKTILGIVKRVHPDISADKQNKIVQAKAPEKCWYAVHYYYSLLCGFDVHTGATYGVQFEWEDLVRLVDCITVIMDKAGTENTDTHKKIGDYLQLREGNDNQYLYVQGEWFTFTTQGKDILVYDGRNRMFNKTVVIRCTGHRKGSYQLCSAFDNFMQFFYMGIVPCLVFSPANNLPTSLSDNVKIMLNKIVSMSKDEMDAQNGGEIYMQKITYHPVVWTEFSLKFRPEMKCNATLISAQYSSSAKKLDTYKYNDKKKTASEFELLGWIAAVAHKENSLTVHFAKKILMEDILSAVNLGLLAKFAPTIFRKMADNLGWADAELEDLMKLSTLINTIKASKAGKRLTLFLTTACTMSRTNQLVYASHRLAGQTKLMCGLRREIVLSQIVAQPGMGFTITPAHEVANILFKKDMYFVSGNYSINPDAGHYFSFEDSDIEGMETCAWTLSTDSKGWYVLTPSKTLTLYGGETICHTKPVNPMPLDGRGKVKHEDKIEGDLMYIRFIEESDLSAGTKLKVMYVLRRDIEQFKLRNTFIKMNEVKTAPGLFFNKLNGNENEVRPVTVITQDAAKLDVITWIMTLIADTVGNPENWNMNNEVFVTLYRMVSEYMEHTSLAWDLSKPVCIIPALVWGGFTNELVEYFYSKFSKVSWFVWEQSAPMAQMMYNLYAPKVVAEEWHIVDSAEMFHFVQQASCSHPYTQVVIFSQDKVITDKTNILVFWFNGNAAVQVAQRSMTLQSAHGVKLTTVLAVELSSILENVSPSNIMPSSLSAINKLVTDKERCNKIQKAAIDSTEEFNYRIAALAQMAGGGDFNLHSNLLISYIPSDPGYISMSANNQAIAWSCIQPLMNDITARRGGHFEAACNALKAYCITVQYKEDKVFTIWMPALLLFSKMRSSSQQANNFVDCFYNDILLPTVQGQKVSVASASSCHGMMNSLLSSEEFLSLFKGPKAAQGKRISAPCIPVGEMWVLYSTKTNSQYQNLKNCGFNLDTINSTTYVEGDKDIIIYTCRAPIALGAFLKVRVIVEKLVEYVEVIDGETVVVSKVEQYAMPLPSDTPEQAMYWKNTPLAYHMTYTQFGQNCDSVYASDIGDYDGDGIVNAVLKYVTLQDVMNSNTLMEIQRCYLGMSAYDVKNDQYIADHFGIKRWDEFMMLATNIKKAGQKALTTYQKAADDSAAAVLILTNGVGVEYRIYATCDILVQILLAATLNNEEVHEQYHLLLEREPESLVLTNAQVYEYTLGGFSKSAKDLFENYLKPMMEGEMNGASLEADVHKNAESSLYKVVKGIGADVSRVKQIARMMVITNYIYQVKSTQSLYSIPFSTDNPLNGLGNVLLAAHAIFELSRNDFKAFNGALPKCENASEKAYNLDSKALECLLGLLQYCRENNPKVIEDCMYLYAAEKTLSVIGQEMTASQVSGSMWNETKLQNLAKYAKIDCSDVQQRKERQIVKLRSGSLLSAYAWFIGAFPGAEAYLPHYQAHNHFPRTEDMTESQWLSLMNIISEKMNLGLYFVIEDEDGGQAPAVAPKTPTPTPEEKTVSMTATTLINDSQLAKAHMNGLNQDYMYLGRLSSTYPHNYGNPYSCVASAISKGALPAPDNDTSWVYFEEWLYGKRDTDKHQEQRKWIIEQLQSGALKGKNIICYAHGGRCHEGCLRDITEGVKPMPVFKIQQEAAPESNEEQHILSNGRAINHRDVKVYFKLLQGKKVYTKIQSWNGTYPLDSGELTEHGFVGYNVKKGFLFASSIEVYNHLDLSKFKNLSYYQGETEYLSEDSLPIRRDFIIFSKWDNSYKNYYSALDQNTGEEFSLDYGGYSDEYGFYCYSTEHKFIFCNNAEMYDKLSLTKLEGYTRYVGKFKESYQRNPNAPEDWKDYLSTAQAGDLYVYYNKDQTVNRYELNGSDFNIDTQSLFNGILWDFNGDASDAKHLQRVFIVKGHPYNDYMEDMFDSCINNETTLEEVFPIYIGHIKHIYPNRPQQQEEPMTQPDTTVYYTGIGKRDGVPDEIVEVIKQIAIYKHQVKGHVLRSGSAAGCDTYFEQAAISVNAPFISYLPCLNFQGRSGANYIHQYDPAIWAQAEAIVRQILGEGYWASKTAFVRSLQIRNLFQLLGDKLDKPSEQVICWTPNGKVVGGTGNTIKMAAALNIPVLNLGDSAVLAKVTAVLAEHTVKAEAPVVVEQGTAPEVVPEVKPGSLVLMQHITRAHVQAHPEQYFVFGDNFARAGYGGQAKEMRGEPNTIGIATKLKPSNDPDAFLTDEYYEAFKVELTNKFNQMLDLINKGHDIVFPTAGIGTGLSNLAETASNCWELLKAYMQNWGLPGYDDAPAMEPNEVQVTESEVISNSSASGVTLTEEDCLAKILDIAKARGKRIETDKAQALFDSLNNEQKKVMYRFFLLDKDIFLTGEGGAGKTYTTCTVRSMLDLLGYPYLHVGTTGISVMNVDGDGTINSKLGLGLGMRIQEGKGPNSKTRDRNHNELYKLSYYKKLVRECRNYLQGNWAALVNRANGMPIVLFLEECSMLGSLLACAADEAIRKEGIKVKLFMSGDLCQAGAVGDYPIYKDGKLEDDTAEVKTELTMTTIFNPERFQFINLLSNMRAQEDQEWIEALRALRLGVGCGSTKSLPKALRKVWNKSVKAFEAGALPTEDVVHLCPTNLTAKKINKAKADELRVLKPESKVIKASIKTLHGVADNWYNFYFNPIEKEMWMCVGMRVMLRANIKKDNVLLAGNGSCGYITGFEDNSVKVLFDNKVELVIKPQALGNGAYSHLGSFTQVPLHPCYAMTITKAQGLTLPGNVILHPYMESIDQKTGEVKVKAIFMKNLLYVAASRCPSSAKLFIWAQVPHEDLVENGEWDYAGAYNFLLDSYVCDHEAANFVKKHVLNQSN